MTKTFKNQAAHGDVLLVRVNNLPTTGLLRQEPKGNTIVLAHSESGHHHYLQLEQVTDAVHYRIEGVDPGSDTPLQGYLEIVVDTMEIRHDKAGPTSHTEFSLRPGVYQIRRHRTWDIWNKRYGRAQD
jgi:hypothetical protein